MKKNETNNTPNVKGAGTDDTKARGIYLMNQDDIENLLYSLSDTLRKIELVSLHISGEYNFNKTELDNSDVAYIINQHEVIDSMLGLIADVSNGAQKKIEELL